jgi:negative regulator of sigma F NrsF-like protein
MKVKTEVVSECASIDRELDRRFEGSSAVESERLRRHLDECDRCRQLHRWMIEAPAEKNGSLNSCEDILNTLKSSVRPVRALPSSGTLVLQFGVVFLLFAAVATAISGIGGLHQMALLQMFGMSAVFLLGTALLSLSLVWQMIPGSLQRYSPKIILPALALLFVLGIVLLFPEDAPEAFLARGWHCLNTGLLMSAAAAFMFWGLIARRGVTLGVSAIGATLGACAGLVSVTVLQVACSHQDIAHLVVWHGAVLAGSVVLGVGIAHALHRISRSDALK